VVEGVTQVSALVVVLPTAAIAADHPSEEDHPRIHLAVGPCLSDLVARVLGQVLVLVQAMEGEEGRANFLVDSILVENAWRVVRLYSMFSEAYWCFTIFMAY
jgi:hypothetical protein